MSFTTSALVLAFVAIALLALGLAGLLRQVTLLTRQLEGGPGAGSPGTGTGAARTTRELVGFRLPEDLAAQVLDPGAGHTVLAFVSPGCSSCSLTLRALAADPAVRDGALALGVVSAGSCEPALADAHGAARLTCRPQGRGLMDRLAVPATPYLALLDDGGTLRAALLPDEDTDLGAWLRQAATPLPMREERSS
ncbi:hypothetical protein SGUI_1718 [Serinicoccus hydrothermalis]|uniref:Thioredoxin domain-containing protein n=1 Tax=Serinicoccus hydrothermalis TaxID=1758689 RepID=A0A1B1NCH7_9MICO|nr:hypothetical protein [Serinicoccus hydrothermalis]ANS79114.1 hypothetical protein SGUI_1718 [Serinicoccus hydrothermalis]